MALRRRQHDLVQPLAEVGEAEAAGQGGQPGTGAASGRPTSGRRGQAARSRPTTSGSAGEADRPALTRARSITRNPGPDGATQTSVPIASRTP
ncbi:hypothetical protein DK419_10845 [Methylobacterium terrae]|uniref:Uncharacterized protein n=1 Tax=Methylobacterium terrae TaxID=2202827 RepID=A0A2U8WME9_9HYPH|nr:hypothetical protein DK419_10845 [Methylobacterium terrae]